MIKTVVLSLTFLASSVGVILLFMFDLDWGLIMSYVFLAIIVLAGLAFWLFVFVCIVYGIWSYLQPHAVLKIDGQEIKIRYSRLNRGERLVLTGPKSDVIQMKVARAPIAEPIEMALGERSVTGQEEHQATLEIEDEVFEFRMFKGSYRWITLGGLHILHTIYSGYFHHVKNPVHFVGEVRYSIYHELETSEIIALHQVS